MFSLLGRVPDLYAAALGSLKYGAVFSPLFSAFGPEPVRQRLALGDARVLVTTEALYRRKVEALRAGLPGLAHVLLVRSDPAAPLPASARPCSGSTPPPAASRSASRWFPARRSAPR